MEFPVWLKKLKTKLEKFDGVVGIEQIENVRFPEICCLMLKFDNVKNLKDWSQSADHGLLVNEITKYSLQPYHSQIFACEGAIHKAA